MSRQSSGTALHYDPEYYQRTKEAWLARCKAYRKRVGEANIWAARVARMTPEDIEKKRARNRAYKKAHREQVSENWKCRRGRIRANQETTDITSKWLLELKVSSDTCPRCGVPMVENGRAYPNGKQLDHIIPISRGGKHMMDNVRYICHRCNATKHTKLDESR